MMIAIEKEAGLSRGLRWPVRPVAPWMVLWPSSTRRRFTNEAISRERWVVEEEISTLSPLMSTDGERRRVAERDALGRGSSRPVGGGRWCGCWRGGVSVLDGGALDFECARDRGL
ncbi:hypothetical protein V8G54_019385, partial [Vigna mungo]